MVVAAASTMVRQFSSMKSFIFFTSFGMNLRNLIPQSREKNSFFLAQGKTKHRGQLINFGDFELILVVDFALETIRSNAKILSNGLEFQAFRFDSFP